MRGEQLRAIREKLGWFQTQMAAALGVTANTVARWERNEVPIREPIERLIRVLVNKGEMRKEAEGEIEDLLHGFTTKSGCIIDGVSFDGKVVKIKIWNKWSSVSQSRVRALTEELQGAIEKVLGDLRKRTFEVVANLEVPSVRLGDKAPRLIRYQATIHTKPKP